MGREIRNVIPNWEHPKDENGKYRPMFDRSYKQELENWINENDQWERGIHPDQDKKYKYYAEYAGEAPDSRYYRPDWKKEDMTWYQMYETVSEGTPVTPPFESIKKLVDYLTKNGTFWSKEPWSKEQAEKFVKFGWMPSSVMTGGKLYSGKDIMDVI